jgi:hypothetical protein
MWICLVVVQNIPGMCLRTPPSLIPVWRNTARYAKSKSGFSKLSAKESLRNRIQQIVSKNIAENSNQQIVSRKSSHSANCQQKIFAFSKYSAKMRTDKGIQQIVSKFLAQESKIGDRSVKEKIYLGQCWPDSYFSQRQMPSLLVSRLKWLG